MAQIHKIRTLNSTNTPRIILLAKPFYLKVKPMYCMGMHCALKAVWGSHVGSIHFYYYYIISLLL